MRRAEIEQQSRYLLRQQREFRRARIEVWHECADLDLAVWLDSQDRLDQMRRALGQSLTAAFKAGRA